MINELDTLVVDDSSTAHLLLQRILESSGAKVAQTQCASEAFEYLEAHKPDVIFMDYRMPGMDGLEATRRLRENPATAAIPVVMYTAESGDDYARMAYDYGAVAVICKPASREKIGQVLSSIFPEECVEFAPVQAIPWKSHFDSLQTQFSERFDQAAASLRHWQQEETQKLEQLAHTRLDQQKRQLSTLFEAIAESKLHQLEIDLRHHIAVKFDLLSQDLRREIEESKAAPLPQASLALPSSAPLRPTPAALPAERWFWLAGVSIVSLAIWCLL